MTELIKFTNVGVRFKKRKGLFRYVETWPLQDLSFELYKGETLGVIGGNGAGKSTLLQLIAGIIKADRGLVDSRDVNILMLSVLVGFQNHLTGRENAVLSGILLGMRASQVISLMDEIISFSELENAIDDQISTYSTGMRARLGYAVAIHAHPDVLLLDEVLGVGDKQFRKKSRKYMLSKLRSEQTIVLVSHDEATIKDYCDRVLWLQDGRVRMIGNADAVVSAYGSE